MSPTTGATPSFARNEARSQDTACHIDFASLVLGMACMATETPSQMRTPSRIDAAPLNSNTRNAEGSASSAPRIEFKKNGPAPMRT